MNGPPLQNVPIKGAELGRRVRRAFISRAPALESVDYRSLERYLLEIIEKGTP